MATSTESPSVQRQVLGGVKSEDADFDNTVRAMMGGDFDEWPNEAGVSSTLQLIMSRY